MAMLRHILAWPVSLAAGLVVLSLSSPVLAVWGIDGSPAGLLRAFPFALAASALPHGVAVLGLRAAGLCGQGWQMLAGAGVAAASVVILTLAFGSAPLSLLSGPRGALGILLAGACAGFVHHAVSRGQDQGAPA